MPVAYTVTSLKSAGKCGPLAITVSWNSSGDKVHHRTIHPNSLAVQAGTISIPGSTIWPGTLRYRVTAKQRCSDGDHAGRPSIGQAPTTGWFKATIK
jgi:hypothetical protein